MASSKQEPLWPTQKVSSLTLSLVEKNCSGCPRSRSRLERSRKCSGQSNWVFQAFQCREMHAIGTTYILRLFGMNIYIQLPVTVVLAPMTVFICSFPIEQWVLNPSSGYRSLVTISLVTHPPNRNGLMSSALRELRSFAHWKAGSQCIIFSKQIISQKRFSSMRHWLCCTL